MSTELPTLEYCFVCQKKLTTLTGIGHLRPLKQSVARTAIPLADQRVTMCKEHADLAVEAGDYALVGEWDERITG